MVEAMYYLSPEGFQRYNENSLFITINDNFNAVVSQIVLDDNVEFVLSRHDETPCQSYTCKYHILLYSTAHSSKDLISLFHQHSFSYQFVGEIYFLYKTFFYPSLIIEKGAVFEKLKNVVHFNITEHSFEHQPGIVRKRLIRKAFRSHQAITNVQTKSRHDLSESLAKRVSSIVNSQHGCSFLQIIDSFVDGFGQVNTELVHFELEI